MEDERFFYDCVFHSDYNVCYSVGDIFANDWAFVGCGIFAMTLYARAITSWQSWRSKRALAASTKRFRKALPEIGRLSVREARQRARHGKTAKVHAQIKAALHDRLRSELEMR